MTQVRQVFKTTFHIRSLAWPGLIINNGLLIIKLRASPWLWRRVSQKEMDILVPVQVPIKGECWPRYLFLTADPHFFVLLLELYLQVLKRQTPVEEHFHKLESLERKRKDVGSVF